MCAYPCGHDCAHGYLHEKVGMIVLTCKYTWAHSNIRKILLWLSHPHPKPKYRHKSQNVCSPPEEIPAPATAHKKRVQKNWSISAGTWSCIHKHVFFCISGTVPPLGINKRVYVYVHVWACLRLWVCVYTCSCVCTYVWIHVWGYCANVFIYVWVWSRSCIHPRRVWLCLYTCQSGCDCTYVRTHVWAWSRSCVSARVDVFLMVSIYKCWRDRAHVWTSYLSIIALMYVWRHMYASLCLCVHTHVGMITLTWIYKHVHMFMLMRTYTCGFCVYVCACVDMI